MKILAYIIYLVAIVTVGQIFGSLGYHCNTWQWWVGSICVVAAYISGLVVEHYDSSLE